MKKEILIKYVFENINLLPFGANKWEININENNEIVNKTDYGHYNFETLRIMPFYKAFSKVIDFDNIEINLNSKEKNEL